LFVRAAIIALSGQVQRKIGAITFLGLLCGSVCAFVRSDFEDRGPCVEEEIGFMKILQSLFFEDRSSRWKIYISTVAFVFFYGVVNNLILNRATDKVVLEAAVLGLLINFALITIYVILKNNPQFFGEAVRSLRFAEQLNEAMQALKQEEAVYVELENKTGLQQVYESQAEILESLAILQAPLSLLISSGYGSQSMVLLDSDRLREALVLYQKQEDLCAKIGNKGDLLRSYNNQLSILVTLNLSKEALILLEKQESLYKSLGDELILAYYYWKSGLIAQDLSLHNTAKEKLQAAFSIFNKIGMQDKAKALQAELSEMGILVRTAAP